MAKGYILGLLKLFTAGMDKVGELHSVSEPWAVYKITPIPSSTVS